MIVLKTSGNFNKTDRFLRKAMSTKDIMSIAKKYAEEGLKELELATPIDSGETRRSWDYQITSDSSGLRIDFTNSHINKGVNVAIILQYGHGTGTGGYVRGIDYINPAIQPIFNKIAEEAWKEVTK